MGTTKDSCGYIEALLTPYLGALPVEGIDLKPKVGLIARPQGTTQGFRVQGIGFRV